MGSRTEINVLGDLQVLHDGEPVDLPPSRKTRALLAFLSVMQRPQRRERLCEMFWEVPDDPRGALRWSLSKIRGILNSGDVSIFSADRNVVSIPPDAVTTDFAKVSALLRDGTDRLGLAEIKAIADAFRGTFLDDLSLPRCPEFEAWRIAHANEMELVRLKALRRLVDELRDQPESALRYAQNLHRLVPQEPGLARLVSELADAARRKSIAAPEGSVPQATERGAAVEVRHCITRDGVRVAYAVTGEGPPIVRGAHWMSHLRYDAESPVWRHWITELSAQNTLVRYDERGNGLSQWDVDDLSFEAMVADLESIIDASGLEKVVLLGVSQGCAVSVAYAVRHPERVLGLVLYGGYVKGWRARGDPDEIALREAMETLMRRGWGKDDPLFRQLFTSVFIPEATREQMDWFNALQRETVTPENAFRLQESFANIDVSDILGQVRAPTLVIHAKRDRVAPITSGQAFAAGIRGARFVELDSSNHILLQDEPAFGEFIGHVRHFAAEVSAVRPAEPFGLSRKRPVTVLALDLVSPLATIENFDPEVLAENVDPLAEMAADLARAHGAAILDVQDGLVTAVFGAERAFEEHTVQACRAARAIRDALSRRDGDIGVRIAIDAGEALIRPKPGSATGQVAASGPVMKSAIRLAGSLARDGVALTARARESAGGFISVSRLQASDHPGLPAGEVVYELIGENRALSRWYLRAQQGLSPLVGRTEEFGELAAAWQAAREGRGQIISIVGSAGVGKSRLAHEFVGSLAFKASTIVEAGAEEINEAVSHDLVKRFLLSLLGLTGEEDGEAMARAVQGRFAELDVEARWMTPVLYALDQPVTDPSWQEMQGAERSRQVRESCAELLRKAAAAKPVLVLVEDLHWADALSRKALEELAGMLADRRILLLLTCRPGFEPAWHGMAHFAELRLPPLPREEGRALATTLLGSDPSLSGLRTLVSERAEGVPLFIEEIIGQLVQTGRVGGKPGAMRMLQPTQRLDIPATLHSVLAARIDKMDPEDRKLLQIASVIGTASPHALLRAVSGLGDALDESLMRLKSAEMLFDSRSDGEAEYVFKHALIKDATYASLAAGDRRRLHARILVALESSKSERRPDQAERLAHHAVRAEDWSRASSHLVAAADRAIERSAYPMAADFLEQAIESLSRLPSTRENVALGIDIRTRLRVAYMVTGQFDKAILRLGEAQAMAQESGDAARLAYTLLHTSYVYSTWGRTTEALAAAGEASTIGTVQHDDRHMAEGDLASAQAYMIIGKAQPALELLLPHVTDFTTRWADDRMGFLVTRSVWFLGSLASTRGLLGEIDEAEADIAEALRLAEATGRPIDCYATAYFESLIRIVAGCSPSYLERLKGLAAESLHRAPFPFHPWLTATFGHAALSLGRRAEAIAALEAAFDAAEQANMPHFMTYASAMLAVAAARPGDAASHDDLVDALRSARRSGDRWIEFEVLMALAEIEPHESAVEMAREALNVARSSGYTIFAARAARRLDAMEAVHRSPAEDGPASAIAELAAGCVGPAS